MRASSFHLSFRFCDFFKDSLSSLTVYLGFCGFWSFFLFIFETRDDRHKTPLSRPSSPCVGLEEKSSPSEEKEEKALQP